MDFEAVADPLAEMDRFREKAEDAGLILPEAMTLATVDGKGRPRARVVLLKKRVGRELQFHTNYHSEKAKELDQNPHAAVCVHYPALQLQVRVEGLVSKLSAEESDSYFESRPRESQLGAWASHQSEPISSRVELEAELDRVQARFEGREIPRPPHWGGYRLVADMVELWIGRAGRFHDRARYTFEDGVWHCQRLQP